MCLHVLCKKNFTVDHNTIYSHVLLLTFCNSILSPFPAWKFGPYFQQNIQKH